MRRFSAMTVAVLVLLLVQPVLSSAPEKYLVLNFGTDGTKPIGITPRVVEGTEFYTGVFLRSEAPEERGFSWRLSDADGNILSEQTAYTSLNNVALFSPEAARLEILSEGEVVHSQRLSFCDSDGECEPCGEVGPDGACRLIENPLTCADCPSGGEDDYCDLYNDSVCDPDCKGFDADCPDCLPGKCFYRDLGVERLSCVDDLGGETCQPRVGCTGRFAYADDSGSLCCVDGNCITTGPPPPVREWCSSLGGVVCPAGTRCGGEEYMPEYGEIVCCISGGCIPVEAQQKTEELEEGPSWIKPLPEEIVESPYFLGILILIELLLLVVLIIMVRRRRK